MEGNIFSPISFSTMCFTALMSPSGGVKAAVTSFIVILTVNLRGTTELQEVMEQPRKSLTKQTELWDFHLLIKVSQWYKRKNGSVPIWNVGILFLYEISFCHNTVWTNSADSIVDSSTKIINALAGSLFQHIIVKLKSWCDLKWHIESVLL